MARMNAIIRIAVCCSLLALLVGCASMYGKGEDPGSNRFGGATSSMDGAEPVTR